MIVVEIPGIQQANVAWCLHLPKIEKAMIHLGQDWCLRGWKEAGSDSGLDLSVL